MIVDPIEVVYKGNHIEPFALLDTGSQITSISESYFQKHFTVETLHKVTELLQVETVSGEMFPTKGILNVAFVYLSLMTCRLQKLYLY